MVIVTLQPQVGSDLMAAAAGYQIADLNPNRTVVLADLENPRCWVFPGYMSALKQVAALIRRRGEATVFSATDALPRPV